MYIHSTWKWTLNDKHIIYNQVCDRDSGEPLVINCFEHYQNVQSLCIYTGWIDSTQFRSDLQVKGQFRIQNDK